MHRQRPLVSVIMAAYNAQGCIRHTITTTLEQTWRDFELIIVDDCSDDQTAAVIRSYHDKRIRLLSNEKNLGQTASLNKALQNAQGHFIARIDADDVSFPQRLACQVQFLENHPGIDVVGSAGLQYDEEGRIVQIISMPQTSQTIRAQLFFTTPLIHISIMARRSSLLAVGGYDETYKVLADYALWSTLLQRGFELMNIPDVLVGYRVSASSVGSLNIHGRSVAEASQIVRHNAQWLAGQTLTQEQAAAVWRYYTLAPSDLSAAERRSVEIILTPLLAQGGYSHRKIHQLFIRKSLRYLRSALAQRPWSYVHLRQTIASLWEYRDGLVAPELVTRYVRQWYQYHLWKHQHSNVTHHGRIVLH